jgi:DNA-binding IclR family transcriptional regulator
MKNGLVQSIQRVFSLMEALASKPEGEGLIRLATETGLSKSTAHRLLTNLIQLGYVMQDRSSRKFYLTVKLFEVGSQVVQHMDILAIAKPFMFDLSRRLGELVNLAVRVQHDVLYIYIEEGGENAVRVAAHMGARNPMYCTAVGKAILAELSDGEIREIWDASDIRPHTPTTITEFPAFMEAINDVRRNGYAFDVEEFEPGIWCIGSCILNYSNTAQGALSVSAPMSRLTGAFRERVISDVRATCRQISAAFGKTQWTPRPDAS